MRHIYTDFFSLLKIWVFLMGICVCVYMNMSAGTLEARRGDRPLELEFRALMSYPVWVLGTKLGSSAREASPLNH